MELYFFPVFIMYFVQMRPHAYLQLKVFTESSSKKKSHYSLYQAETCCQSNVYFIICFGFAGLCTVTVLSGNDTFTQQNKNNMGRAFA
jgi:hypothetical protein